MSWNLDQIEKYLPLIPGGQAQTLMGFFWPNQSYLNEGTDAWIPLRDQDQLYGKVFRGKNPYVLIFFHGLGGSIESNYLSRAWSWVRQTGCSLVLINHRGVGPGAEKSQKMYHSNRAADLSDVLLWVKKEFPDQTRVALGFSFSGNLILNLLGGQSGDEKPEFAVVVNPAADLQATSDRLGQGFNQIYDKNFVADFRKMKWAPEIPKNFRLKDFDAAFTAPSAGFASREEYYAKCSSKNYASGIQTPTLILASHNDPLVPAEVFTQTKWPAKVQLHIEQQGGHIGYISKGKTCLGTRRWLDYFLFKCVSQIIRSNS